MRAPPPIHVSSISCSLGVGAPSGKSWICHWCGSTFLSFPTSLLSSGLFHDLLATVSRKHSATSPTKRFLFDFLAKYKVDTAPWKVVPFTLYSLFSFQFPIRIWEVGSCWGGPVNFPFAHPPYLLHADNRLNWQVSVCIIQPQIINRRSIIRHRSVQFTAGCYSPGILPYLLHAISTFF